MGCEGAFLGLLGDVFYLWAVRISWRWLNELVEIAESPEAVAERLTRAGLEVEGLTSYRRLPAHLEAIRIGYVTHIEKHPNADKLWVATVRVGEDRTYTIVTGADNVRVGDKVPVALPGAVLQTPKGELKIEARPFRGVLSEGMLCSVWELGLGGDAEGIWILSPEAPVGERLTQYLGDYEDLILEISATPNRGDALSHWGIAREYAVLTGAPLRKPSYERVSPSLSFPYALRIPNEEAVPRYGGIYIEGLSIQETPAWIRHRLEVVGLRPIHPIVDVTNYILVGFGQPLHAFDADKLVGEQLWVGPLEEGVLFETLGGKGLELRPGDIVIADGEGAACLGGLIGGLRTAVSETTCRIFLESAYFSPKFLRRTSRRLGLSTESGYRFIRGTDPQAVPWAAEYALALLAQMAPNLLASPFVESHAPAYTAPYKVHIHLPTIRKVTGLSLSEEEVETYLRRLDIHIEAKDVNQTWHLSIPRYRLDVNRPVDVAEELLRIVGWEKLPTLERPLPFPYQVPSAEERRFLLREALSEFLTGLGLWEIRTNSLSSLRAQRPDFPTAPVRLYNPLYVEVAYLRTTLATALDVIAYNRNHGAPGYWAYEWGRIYGEGVEVERLALWGWGRPPFYTLQPVPLWEAFLAILESLLQRLGVPYRLEGFYQAEGSLWLEGVRVYHEAQLLGVAGLLHPQYKAWATLESEPIAYAELDAEALLRMPARQPLHYKPLSLFPVVIKDLSFYKPPECTYAELITAVKETLAPEGVLQHIEPFDCYTDPQKGLSYGIRLYFQAPDRTLQEGDIHRLLTKAILALERLGAQVRKAEKF